MKKKQTSKPAAPQIQVDLTVSLEEQIARRAHELWQQRAGRTGNDIDDWLQAEREVKEWHQQRSQNNSAS